MSETKWTEGSWSFEPPSGGLFDSFVGLEEGYSPAMVFGDRGEPIAEAKYDDCNDDADFDRRDNDLRLMAASKHLYEALTNTLSLLNGVGSSTDDVQKAVVEQAHAALAAARGEE